ncbi:MAG: toxin-antitoxin system YwqK family antitoxin, partial [Bacteroidota bacterium]
LLSTAHLAKAQKKVSIFDLDLINDQFIQRNTIGPFSGTATEEHGNGKKKLSMPIKAGKIEGTVREWAKNGTKVYEVEYKSGQKNGTETQWYATGVKKSTLDFSNGLANGTFTEWYKNKQKKSEGLFTNDREEGMHQWWYSTGQLQQKVNYREGQEEGLVQNWYKNGQKRLETEYTNGQKNGRSTEWFANGQQKTEGRFKADVEHGDTRYWSKQGLLLALQTYDEGKLVKDINYRSGAINLGRGYLQVFNEAESFFTVHVSGERVLPRESVQDITYSVDGQLLQLFNYPVSKVRDQDVAGADAKSTLENFIKIEEAYIEQMTGADIDIQREWKENKNGLGYVKWWFVSPSSKDEEQKARTVQQEFYISFMCNRQILNLYSVVTNSDDPVRIQQMLKRIADSVAVKQERIDLNAIVSKMTRKSMAQE